MATLDYNTEATPLQVLTNIKTTCSYAVNEIVPFSEPSWGLSLIGASTFSSGVP